MKVTADIPQGTTEWLYLRSGIPTASEADRIVTPTGNATAATTSEKYLFELLAERITGKPAVEAPKLWWAERGKELEESARSGYEFTRDVIVDPVSFITDDDGRWGCSPDGLIGDDGLVEFKAPNCADHLAILMKSGVAFKKYGVQCQFQLFVCNDRAFVDLSSYYPGLPQAIVRIERHPEMQKMIAQETEKFAQRLERMTEEAIANGWNVQWRKPRETNPVAKLPPLPSLDEMLKTVKETLRA